MSKFFAITFFIVLIFQVPKPTVQKKIPPKSRPVLTPAKRVALQKLSAMKRRLSKMTPSKKINGVNSRSEPIVVVNAASPKEMTARTPGPDILTNPLRWFRSYRLEVAVVAAFCSLAFCQLRTFFERVQ